MAVKTVAVPDVDRYARQQQFAGIGRDGQERLAAARVAIVGVGALGTALASQLVRAGVGYVRLIDADAVDVTNLQRQVLFDEADAAAVRPKALAAAERLRAANSLVTVEPVVRHLHAGNAAGLLRDVDLILDGTDNFATRFLINDIAVRDGVPWVYGAVAGARGTVMAIRPGVTPCLRCLYPVVPEDGPGCDGDGVIGPAVQFVTALQAAEALKLLAGRVERVGDALVVADLWENRIDQISVAGARREDCPACGRGEFAFLNGAAGPDRAGGGLVVRRLCGRDTIAVWPEEGGMVDRALMARGQAVMRTGIEQGCQFTVFANGRAHFHGIDDPEQARALYARYAAQSEGEPS